MRNSIDAADTGNNARSYSISGTGTSDTLTFDLNGVDLGAGAMTYTGIETLTLATSGTTRLDGAHTMTATAATEKMIITGTAGTVVLGNLTLDQIDSSGFSGTSITMGIMGQMTMLTGGSGAETIIGSTAADTLSGGAGADFLQNQAVTVDDTSNDIRLVVLGLIPLRWLEAPPGQRPTTWVHLKLLTTQ